MEAIGEIVNSDGNDNNNQSRIHILIDILFGTVALLRHAAMLLGRIRFVILLTQIRTVFRQFLQHAHQLGSM